MLKFNFKGCFHVVLLKITWQTCEKEHNLDSSYPNDHRPGWPKLVSVILDK